MSPLQKALDEIMQDVSDLNLSKQRAQESINETFDVLEKEICRRRGSLLRKTEAIFNEKNSALINQATEIRKYIEEMEEGLDVIFQSLSGTGKSVAASQKLAQCYGEKNTKLKSPTEAFFLHKQISKTIDDLCKYKIRNGDISMKKDDSGSTVSEHSVRLSGTHGVQVYQAPVKLTVPCDNSHIATENLQNVNKVRHMISNIGELETSRAVAQKCALSGECLTTGMCKVGHENTIILTAKTWLGELETSGKVLASVDIKYIGPNEECEISGFMPSVKSNVFSQRKTPEKARKAPLGNTFSPRSPAKSNLKKKKPGSPMVTTSRSPLKDIFMYANTGPEAPMGQTKSNETTDDTNSTEPTFQIDYLKNGAYEITFVPKISGYYDITVRVYGRDIPQGSFTVLALNQVKKHSNIRLQSPAKVDKQNLRQQTVRQKGMKRPPSVGPKKNPIEDDLIHRIGGRGRGVGEFSNPQGVAIDHLGRLLVADSTNQCIQVFSITTKKDREPKYLFKFGERGRGSGQVQRPTGVYGLPNGDIAVSDYDNKLVKIFAEDGSCKYNIGNGKLMGPKGLCVDGNGHLVVVDNKLCQVFVFQMNGKLVTKFGSRGTEPHQLAGPHFVAVSSENHIYVSDFYNHCVKIFTPRGDFISSIGSTGEGCGQFNAPTGVAIDSRGNILVSDWGNSRLQVFDKRGSFLTYINSAEDPLYGPQDLTLTTDEQVAVADSGNHCVKIYRYLQ